MIYLHPSLGITNAPATPPRITDPSYIDRIYEFVGGNKAQFSFVIESSNGTVLDDIKETRLTAHLFDAEGRELTEYLTTLSLYWEEHNETWTEVGRGWSYLVNDNSRFLRLLRVRVSQLDIMTALGVTIDAETKKTLAGIMVQQEVKITSSSSIYNRIPSADLIHQQLVNDTKFRELVKGDKGVDGKDGRTPVITLNEKYQLLADGQLLSQQSLKGEQGVQGPRGIQGPQGAKGADGTPGAPGKDGKSVTPKEVVSALNTDSFRESVSRLIDLNKLATSAASKVVGDSTLLAKVREGMATYSDLQSIKAQVDGHQVNWETLEVNYIAPLRQLQNQLKAKQARIEGNVDKEIIRFAYRAALQSEWSDYPSTEWVGNSGYHPDPWGGGGPEGYYRTVHNYELWRSMDSVPPIHIEQSKRTLRQKEYKVGSKPHRDGSATIVYDIQSLGSIESGRARHWRLFTTPHVTSILRYGGKTYMGTPSSSGYTNFALDSGTTYDIYAYNSGGDKYELFIVRNGSYK